MSKSNDTPVKNKPGLRTLLKSGTRMSHRQNGEEQKKSDTATEEKTEVPSDTNERVEAVADPLTSDEAQTLAECEERIHEANMSFLQAGKALETINVQRLYRERHKTFRSYLENRWGFTPQRADQLIRASEVATAIDESDPEGKLPKPGSEGQLRPLTRLADLNEAPLVWQVAAESANGERITARTVAAAIEDLGCELKGPAKAPPKPPSPRQVVGRINDFASALAPKVSALVPGTLTKDDASHLRQGVRKLGELIQAIEDRLELINEDVEIASTSEAQSG